MGTTQTGVEMIAAERQRQVDVEGYTADVDRFQTAALAAAGACYATPAGLRETKRSDSAIPRLWPWGAAFWRPTPDDRVRELVKAGALIAAAIDSLLPATPATTEDGTR